MISSSHPSDRPRRRRARHADSRQPEATQPEATQPFEVGHRFLALRRGARRVGALSLLAVTFGGLCVSPASAQTVKAISVEPSSGLTGGTKIVVSAPKSTFPAGADLFVGICNNDEVLPTDGSGCAVVGGGGALNTKAQSDGSLADTELTVTTGELNPGGPTADQCPPTPDQVAAGTSCVVTVTTFDGQVAGFRFLTFDPQAAVKTASVAETSSAPSSSAQSSVSTNLSETRPEGSITGVAASLADSAGISLRSSLEAAEAGGTADATDGDATTDNGDTVDTTPATTGLLVAAASEDNPDQYSLTGLGWTPGAALGAFKVEFCQALECGTDRVTIESMATDAAGGLAGSVTVSRPQPCVACALKVTDTTTGDVATTTLGKPGEPTLGITPASGKKGAKITVLGTGWRAGGTISIALVGPPYDGTAVGTASNITANDAGQISGTLTVAARDLEVAGAGGALAVAAADLGDPDVLEGLKEPYVVPFKVEATTASASEDADSTDKAGNSPLRVISAKLEGSGPWLSWLGGRPERTLVVTVQNVSDLPIDQYQLRLEPGKAIVIKESDVPKLQPLEAGAKATYKIPVKLRPLTIGTSSVPGQFKHADGVASFTAKSGFTFPWLLAALLLGILGVIIGLSRGDDDDDDDDWVASLSDPDGTPAIGRSGQAATRADELARSRDARSTLSVVPEPGASATTVTAAGAELHPQPETDDRFAPPAPSSIDWLADEPTEPFTPAFSDDDQPAALSDTPDSADADADSDSDSGSGSDTATIGAALTSPNSAPDDEPASARSTENTTTQVPSAPLLTPAPAPATAPVPHVHPPTPLVVGAAAGVTAVGASVAATRERPDRTERPDHTDRAGLSITPVSKTVTLRRASLGDGMTVFHGKIDDVSVTDQRSTSLGWTAVIEPETMDDLRGGVLHVRPKLGRVVEGNRQGLRRSSPSVAEPGLPSPLLEAKSGSGKGTYSTGATLDLVLPSRVSDTKTLAINVVLSAVADDTPVQSAG